MPKVVMAAENDPVGRARRNDDAAVRAIIQQNNRRPFA